MAAEPLNISVAGHQIKLNAEAEEAPHIERAAKKVTEHIQSLEASMPGAPPAKVASMVAFQFAFELSLADEILRDADNLHRELHREREAVKRLESLLTRMDDVLAT